MLTQEFALEFADHWVQSWNMHDLETILSHYAEDVVLISPIAAQLVKLPSGTVTGKPALRAYFQLGLVTYPNLQFQLLDVLWGLSSIVLYYSNQNGTKAGEFMAFNSVGKVNQVVANYNPTKA